MRLDDVAPRTLLLGAVAGWALLAWLLAAAGMGGRLPPYESGAITAQQIPSLPRTSVAPVLGPISQYAGIATRPLFAADRRPHPFSLQSEGAPAEAAQFDLILTSVLLTPQMNLAIVQKPDGAQSWRVHVGDAPEPLPNWRLVSLTPRGAVFEGPEGRKELALRVYGGKPGNAGTADAVPPGTPGGPSTDPPATMGSPMPATGVKPATTSPAPTVPPAPPATDASAPDPAQIEAIRQRIEARREQMRRQAQSGSPPATVVPAKPPTR